MIQEILERNIEQGENKENLADSAPNEEPRTETTPGQPGWLQEGEKPSKEQKRTTEKKELFLRCFIETECYIGLACKRAGINKDTFYDWKKKDPTFCEKLKSDDVFKKILENKKLG